MRIFNILILLAICTSESFAAIKIKTIEYKSGDAVLEGYLAWDDAIKGKVPGVMVIHEWWGNDDYSRKRARDVAALGYVGFAIDMYSKGKTTNDAQQADAWAGAVRKDPKKMQALLQAALDTLKAQTQVDPNRVAAIGYCFGGSMALNMARLGMDVDGVVSFHGDLSRPPVDKDHPIKARLLVAHGGDDTFVPPQQVEQFKQEMTAAGADFQIIVYPGAVHSFTNPAADQHNIPGVKYDAKADTRSWQDLVMFLGKVFGPEQSGAAAPAPNAPEHGEYRLEGEVAKPGRYSLTNAKITLRQAYISAGGQFPKAGKQMVFILTRMDGSGGATTHRVLVTDVLSGRCSDIPLASGDVITVQNSS